MQLRPGRSLGGAQYNLPRVCAGRRTAPPWAPDDRRAERPDRHHHNKSKHKPYEAPSPSELDDDDEYATNPPNLGFFSTGGGASANRRFSTTGI